ncbi:hypothetical protein [Yinghuangia soli]|uniref:Uncharacterized protein n=1 Tax=Yinghuangia soli TaxID=2908204 RepID=A0AA41Q4M5_9ACTN|nr:hypothetical protein [Yinghuangia soli]MCF2531251.1 hypothetical protein [Yinghuangia soli]
MAGCTGGASNEPDYVRRPVTSAAGIVLPLDAYRQTDAELEFAGDALSVLVQRCMTRYGVPWPSRAESGWPRGPRPSGIPRNGRLYGVIDAAQVARIGYRPPAPPLSTLAVRAPSFTLPGAQQVFTGSVQTYQGQAVPPGGCSAEANTALTGRAEVQPFSLDSPLDDLAGLSSATEEPTDPRVIAANKAWSACMKKAGYSYADPWAANNDERLQQGDTAGAEEIAVASADVACRTKTDLTTIWHSVTYENQEKVVRENAELLAKVRADIDACQRKAAEVLAPAPPKG